MNTLNPYQIPDPPEPLVASPKVTCHLLSIGMTRLYELIDTGELETSWTAEIVPSPELGRWLGLMMGERRRAG